MNPAVLAGGGGMVLVLAALIGAIMWNLITWYWTIPSSSSHALIGGVIGATIVASGSGAINVHKLLQSVIVPAVLSPFICGAVALLGTFAAYRLVRMLRAGEAVKGFRLGQIGSASLVSLAHGTNDAQKSHHSLRALHPQRTVRRPCRRRRCGRHLRNDSEARLRETQAQGSRRDARSCQRHGTAALQHHLNRGDCNPRRRNRPATSINCRPGTDRRKSALPGGQLLLRGIAAVWPRLSSRSATGVCAVSSGRGWFSR